MFEPDPSSSTLLASRLPGSVRNAEARDAAAISRLLAANDVDPRTISTAQGSRSHRGQLLVLDIDGAVRAAVHVVFTEEHGLRGRLQLLVVDPALTRMFGRTVEDRLVGVAVALCEAFGCTDIARCDSSTPARDHLISVA